MKVNTSELHAIVTGHRRPKSDLESISTSLALVWGKTWESALKTEKEGEEVKDPQEQQIIQYQSQWMGCASVAPLTDLIDQQLNYLKNKP